MAEIKNNKVNGVTYATEAEAAAAQKKAQNEVVEASGINNASYEAKNDEVNITSEDHAKLQGVLNELEKIKINVQTTNSESSSTDGSNSGSKSISQLESDIAVYTAQLEYLNNTIDSNKAELKAKQEKLAAEEKEQKALQDKIKEEEALQQDKQNTINTLSEKIKKKQKLLASTDPSSPEYTNIIEDLQLFNLHINELANESSTLLSNISTLQNKLEAQTQTVNSLHTSIDNLNNFISSLETQVKSIETQKITAETSLALLKAEQATTTETPGTIGTGGATTVPASLSNMISQKEWDLVGKNNINMTEKLADGSPRYIIAKGQRDGQYHIYDMGNNGASLARQYGESRGFDIIQNGNGYIRNYNTNISEGKGNECFYMEDCDKLVSFNACYCTCSPLSLDIDGNGVGTLNSLIDYDIDGDGKMDKINDSADAVLVFDKDGDGVSGANGSECFGNNTDLNGDGVKDGFKNGFEALKALALQNGLIDGVNDNSLDEDDIKLLEEKFGLKLKTNGYNSNAESLLSLGITEINFAKTDETTLQDNFDGQGNQLMQQQGATFKINGEEREYADIWHKKKDENGNIAPSVKDDNKVSNRARTAASISSTLNFLMAKNKSYTIKNINQQSKMANLSELAPENAKNEKEKAEFQKTLAKNAAEAKKKEEEEKEEEEKEEKEEKMELDE